MRHSAVSRAPPHLVRAPATTPTSIARVAVALPGGNLPPIQHELDAKVGTAG